MTHSPAGSTSSATVSRIDHRDRLSAIKNQGRRATCMAFAVTAVHEYEEARLSGSLRDLSEEMLFWGCKCEDFDTEDATSFPSAQIALETSGQVEEHLWPYEPIRSSLGDEYQPPAAATAPGLAARAILEPLSTSVAAIKQTLLEGAIVVLGFQMYQGIYCPKNYIIPLPEEGEEKLGGHVVALVGFDDAVEGGCFIVRNSWGESWADRGYAYLPYGYLSLTPVHAYNVRPSCGSV